MSPVLASLFLHYAFDLWLGREFPRPSSSVTPTMRWFTARVCRRHSGSWPRCGSERPRWGWSCAPVRRGSCTARTATAAAGSSTGSSRSCGSPSGRAAPRTGAVVLHRVPARDQQESSKKLSETVRSWRLHRRTGSSSTELAAWINPVVRGWMAYYGHYYRSAL